MIQEQRYLARFVGRKDDTPLFALGCPDAGSGPTGGSSSKKRLLMRFLGLVGNTPLYGYSTCEFPRIGRFLMRFVGMTAENDPVYTIGDLSTVWLVANVRESDAPRMKVGAPVHVTVLAFPAQVFNARLDYVAPALDPNTRRLPVRAAVGNPDLGLKPEMFASFRIVSGEDRSMPAVPVDSIVYEGANARVWVARPDAKTVVSRPIVVGDTSNGLVEVKTKRVDVAFVAPGADFRPYTKLMVDPTQAAFHKDWIKNMNDRRDLSRMVHDEDAQKVLEAAKTNFADVFREAFTKAGYTAADGPGPDVLRVTPGVMTSLENIRPICLCTSSVRRR